MIIRVMMTGRSYQLSSEMPDTIELAEGATVRDAVARIESLLPGDQRLHTSCLVAVGGQHVGTIGDDLLQALNDGDELVLIAPVAGG